MATNNSIVEAGERLGVRTYIFAPCIVCKCTFTKLKSLSDFLIHRSNLDGEGEGFGKKISIQTVAIVKAAKALGRMYKFDQDSPVCELSMARATVLPPKNVAGFVLLTASSRVGLSAMSLTTRHYTSRCCAE